MSNKIEEKKISDEVSQVTDKKYTSYAWCKCGDALTGYVLKDDDGMNREDFFHCLGCDDYYVLNKVSPRMVKFLIGDKSDE